MDFLTAFIGLIFTDKNESGFQLKTIKVILKME